jgi:1,5-anhydro-D-fructose reductase (1,5-anhydro-D-mannitol-forming)
MLNWLVIGIGDISTRRVIPAILSEPRSRLYGMVTRNPAKAAAYNTHVWPTLDEALTDPAIDAVYVATPVFLHAPQTIQSLRADKHVLCEKPMAMNEAEARAMVETAEETRRTLGVAYYRRNYPKVQRAKNLLEASVIGKPVFAELTCHGWFDGKEYDGADRERYWLIDPMKSGGGPLFDIASHRIDVLNYWFGRPQRVSGHLSNAVHHYPVEDNATVMIDYADGVRGIIDVRWHSRIKRDECRIRGTDGEMELSPLNGPDLVYPGGRESLPVHANVHLPLIADFVSTVENGTPLPTSGANAYWTDWVIEHARKVS